MGQVEGAGDARGVQPSACREERFGCRHGSPGHALHRHQTNRRLVCVSGTLQTYYPKRHTSERITDAFHELDAQGYKLGLILVQFNSLLQQLDIHPSTLQSSSLQSVIPLTSKPQDVLPCTAFPVSYGLKFLEGSIKTNRTKR